jgi:hypothetical protein
MGPDIRRKTRIQPCARREYDTRDVWLIVELQRPCSALPNSFKNEPDRDSEKLLSVALQI